MAAYQMTLLRCARLATVVFTVSSMVQLASAATSTYVQTSGPAVVHGTVVQIGQMET